LFLRYEFISEKFDLEAGHFSSISTIVNADDLIFVISVFVDVDLLPTQAIGASIRFHLELWARSVKSNNGLISMSVDFFDQSGVLMTPNSCALLRFYILILEIKVVPNV
jgi:hypothetical protein